MHKNEQFEQSIVVYGAGGYGHLFAAAFPNRIQCFIDQDDFKQRNGFEGYEVISIDAAEEKYIDSIIVVALSDSAIKIEIMYELKERGFHEIRDIEQCFLEYGDIINEKAELNGVYAGYDYSLILREMFRGACRSEWFYHLGVWENYCCRYLITPIRMLRERYLPKGSYIADFGAGYGFWSMFFAKAGCKVSCLERDKSRLEILNNLKINVEGLKIVEADIISTDEADGHYDMTFCANTIHVISRWQDVVTEMVRITKTGGLLVFVATNPECPRVLKDYSNGDKLRKDCTITNIEKLIFGVREELIEIRQGKDVIPSHHILVVKKVGNRSEKYD